MSVDPEGHLPISTKKVPNPQLLPRERQSPESAGLSPPTRLDAVQARDAQLTVLKDDVEVHPVTWLVVLQGDIVNVGVITCSSGPWVWRRGPASMRVGPNALDCQQGYLEADTCRLCTKVSQVNVHRKHTSLASLRLTLLHMVMVGAGTAGHQLAC